MPAEAVPAGTDVLLPVAVVNYGHLLKLLDASPLYLFCMTIHSRALSNLNRAIKDLDEQACHAALPFQQAIAVMTESRDAILQLAMSENAGVAVGDYVQDEQGGPVGVVTHFTPERTPLGGLPKISEAGFFLVWCKFLKNDGTASKCPFVIQAARVVKVAKPARVTR